MNNEKPVVRYNTRYDYTIDIGQRAFVFPIDHPDPEGQVSNTMHVITSTVISYDNVSGIFETNNTIYKPFRK